MATVFFIDPHLIGDVIDVVAPVMQVVFSYNKNQFNTTAHSIYYVLSFLLHSCLTGTQEVAAKTLSENEPPHQRSPHNDAIWSMETKDNA
jgi:hypothetical protein